MAFEIIKLTYLLTY